MPSVATLIKKLSPREIDALVAMKPLVNRLEEIAEESADLERRIAELAGGKAPKRRGRRPGRPAKTAPPPAKRGRGRPPKTKPAAKVGRPRGRPAKAKVTRTPEQQAIINARMAKARAARKVNAKG